MISIWLKRVYYFVIFLISVYVTSFLIFVVIQEVYRIQDRPGIGRQPFYIILIVTFVISSVAAGSVITWRHRKKPGPEDT